ncbi:hypothetical protein ACMD2_15776, partial [Ananas comosus]
MAEPESLLYTTKPPIHHRQLGAGILSTFLYRALLVAVLVVALPLLPSRAPEFVDGTLLTRTWELLHLLLVGIAISYGLFSRRNADADKDRAAAGKHDAAQSYVPQILRGPSAVFGDDDDGVDGDDDRGDAGVRAWSSQYYPNDPVVVVAKDSGSAGGGRGRGRGGDEPLLLPVRSLKSRAREADSGRNRFSRTPDEDAAVLSSPIPWRSHELKDVSAKPLMKPQSSINIPSSIAKSVRTVRPKEAQATQAADGPEIPVPVPMYRRKEDSEFVDKAVIESDDSDSRDSDSSDERETDDDDIIAESSGKEDEAPNCVAEAKAEAEPDDNEVDKKADEFIAKFREQIRLQRIESIKRSTRRRSDKHP